MQLTALHYTDWVKNNVKNLLWKQHVFQFEPGKLDHLFAHDLSAFINVPCSQTVTPVGVIW